MAAVLVLLLVCSGAAAAAGSWNGDVFTPDANGYATAQALVDDLGGDNASCSDDGKTVTLLKDIILGGTLIIENVTEGAFILDLNGTVLSAKSDGSFSVIKVDLNKYLNLTDSNSTNPHCFKFVDNNNWTYVGPTAPYGTTTVDLANFNLTEAKAAGTAGYYVNVTGGVITGGSASTYGGGVYVEDGGNFTICGGNIVGNSVSTTISYGGGVYVFNNNAKFTMTGGNIIGNSAGTYGGGVYVFNNNAKFTMTGGNITGNSAKDNGGGVYVNSGGNFTMSGNASVTGNTASYGGGVYVDGAGNFTMSGNTSITGNSVSGEGGGVWSGGTFKVKDAPFIKNNTKTDGTTANNVNLDTPPGITLVGPLTDGAYIGIINPRGGNAQIGERVNPYTISDNNADYFHPDKYGPTAKWYGNDLKWYSETPTPAPSSPSSSSRSYGASIWLTATPTPTPVAEATPEPTLAQPVASPVKPTPQASTPVPVACVLAGLGAAALVFGLRRK